MRFLKIILIFALLAGGVMPIAAGAPSWEVVQTLSPSSPVSEQEKPEVWVSDGYIYITVAKPVNVKVMSIVGQLISEQKVSAGTSRLKIASRGIYILKAAGYTLRVTI